MVEEYGFVQPFKLGPEDSFLQDITNINIIKAKNFTIIVCINFNLINYKKKNYTKKLYHLISGLINIYYLILSLLFRLLFVYGCTFNVIMLKVSLATVRPPKKPIAFEKLLYTGTGEA